MADEPLPGAPTERELDLRYYGDLLWRGRLVIVAATLCALLLGILVGYLQVPEYTAASMLQIEPPTPTFMTVADALMTGGSYYQNSDFYNTQFRVLRSRGIAGKVIDKLKLKDQPEFKDAQDPVALFISHVGVEPIPDSRLVMVQISHADPKEAALWANTLAAVYTEESLASRMNEVKRAYEWIQERLSATEGNMHAAKEKLLKTYENQDLFVPEGSTSVVISAITRLNADYIDAQARRIALEAAFKQVAEMRKRGLALDRVPQIAADTMMQGIISQVAALNLQLGRLRESYKEGHPQIQSLHGQIDELNKASAARADVVVEGMRAEFVQIQKRENELRAAIDVQKGVAASQGLKGIQLDTLRKEADSANSLYDVLLQKLSTTDIAASLRNEHVSVVEQATPPHAPVRPNRSRLAGMAAMFGLVLGVGLVLGRDFLHNSLRDPDEIERYLHADLLTAVPRYEDVGAHVVTEAYQNLRTALLFGRKDDGGQVVLITSTAPQEGKTTTLLNLGQLMAAAGDRTLALDFDMRRASLHHRLGLTREPGVADFFSGSHRDLAELIRPTRFPGLSVLTAGPIPPNPPAILARRNMGDFMAKLRQDFDWILVDSPPLASVTDALLIARQADITLFVVEHSKVDKRLVKRSVASLRKVTDSLLGVVLNAVSAKAQGYYYYYYHHAYGNDAKPLAKVDPTRTGPKGVVRGRKSAV